MPNEFWPLLRDAWATVKELNGIGLVLPDPTILLKPIEDREAIQSSRIEGTFATARELLLFEMLPHSPSSSAKESDKKNTWREVWNYRQELMDLPTKCGRGVRVIRPARS
jgi:Fic family protein